MKSRLFFLSFCILAVLITGALSQIQAISEQVTEVSLKRWTRMSAPHEPVDIIVLRSDGTATYNTEKEWAGLSAGNYKGTFHPIQFRRLTELLESQKFFEMADTKKTAVRHTTMHTTTVVRSGKSKSVVNYDNHFTPVSLWSLEMAVRGVAGDIHWKKVDAKAN